MTPRTARLFAAFGIVAHVGWTIGWAVEGVRAHHYDGADQYISELAATGAPTASVMIPVFVLLGVGTIAQGLALATRPGVKTVPALVVAAGVCAIGAGVFRCDPGCPNPPDGSWHNVIHGLVSAAYFVTLIAAALIAALLRRHDSRGYAAFSACAGVLAAVAALMMLAFEGDKGAGIAQRVSVFTLSVWSIVAAARFLQSRPVHQPRPVPTLA